MSYKYKEDTNHLGYLKETYKKKIYVDHSFIPKDICSQLVNHCSKEETLYAHGFSHNEPTEFAQIYTSESALKIIDDYITEAIKLATARYGRSLVIYDDPKIRLLPPLKKPLPGSGYLHLHSDSEYQVGEYVDLSPSKDEKQMSIHNLAEISILLYFNDDFSGGEVLFPDYDLEIKPTTGMLLMFPSGHQYKHRVNEVTSGKRIYCPIFLTQPKMLMFYKYHSD